MHCAPLVALLTVALAGCGGGSTPAVHAGQPGSARYPAGPLGRLRGLDAGPVTASSGAPGCSTANAPGSALRGVPAAFVRVPPEPFGVTTTADGRWAFVSSPGQGVAVLSTRTPVPRLVRVARDAGGAGEALTRDGRYLLVADGTGAALLSVSGLERRGTRSLLGTLVAGRGAGGGAIEVTTSPDGRFAFVSLEGSARIAVFDLARALASGLRSSALVGYIPTELAPVGLAVSADGDWLYATSEIAAGGRGGAHAPGTLGVIDLRRAETEPSRAAVVQVTAGCQPVRVAVSPDGATVWVTARASDRLLGFSAAALRTDPRHALVASVPVGEAPVGLALAAGGALIVVDDSNRFEDPRARAGLTVVSARRALARRPAVLGSLPAGRFPRESALEAGGRTLLVTNFDSAELEAVDLTSLLTAARR